MIGNVKCMRKTTFVCCFNNLKMFSKLKAAINEQTVPVDVIGINNTGNKFDSCSMAFNSVLNRIKTPYVVFLHQDIVLDKITAENFEKYMEQILDGDILGVAGIDDDTQTVYSNIHSSNKCKIGNQLIGMKKCQAVDECFFGGYTSTFINEPFDENLCNNWHLYAVELCHRALKLGHSVYVCDVHLIHLSPGKVNHKFNEIFYKICKKYRKDFKFICAPCLVSKTYTPYRQYTFLRSELKVLLGKY